MKNQIGIKVNEQEKKELIALQELLNVKDTFGCDSQTYKEAVRLATLYLNKVKPYFVMYEQLFIKDKDRLFKGNSQLETLHELAFLD